MGTVEINQKKGWAHQKRSWKLGWAHQKTRGGHSRNKNRKGVRTVEIKIEEVEIEQDLGVGLIELNLK